MEKSKEKKGKSDLSFKSTLMIIGFLILLGILVYKFF